MISERTFADSHANFLAFCNAPQRADDANPQWIKNKGLCAVYKQMWHCEPGDD